MSEQSPMVGRKKRHQILLDLHRIGLFGETKQAAEASDMRIDHHSFVDSIGVAEDNVGGFATHAGERGQVGNGFGDFSVKVVDQPVRHSDQVFRLAAEKSGCPHQLFHIFLFGVCELLRCGIPLKERRCNQIHAPVGALCA